MTPSAAIFAAVFLPMLAPALLAPLGRRLGDRTAWVALVFPVVSFASLSWLCATHAGPMRVVEWSWVPSLGVSLRFGIDGLSLFFAMVVSGMGVLVVFYARFYLDGGYAHHGRFHAYLILFMAAMLGTVLSDHLLLLFCFWELTGVASFLLIGFLHADEGSRRGARMALLVTGGTGLAALAGIVLVRQATGTYSLSEIVAGGGMAGRPLAGAAMVLMLLGAFGKSAQFPLHFWLPNAMAAPTPVSAYLHSATMVKLGVFLVARLFPVFGGHAWWAPVVATVAFVTLVLGGVMALLSTRLKAILAYSTVSQLGFLIGYYGLGPEAGVDHDYWHILNHVFYKGSLFMVVGVIYAATHATDLGELGGLWRRMPSLAVVAGISCAAMLGLPGTTGFLSKELMFQEIFLSPKAHGWLGLMAVVSVVFTSLVKVAFSVRLFQGVFLGREPEGLAGHFHAPSRWMVVPPAVLAAAALVFGVAPELLAGALRQLAVPGLHSITPPEVHLWHGWTRELAVSVAVVVGGCGLVALGNRTRWKWARLPRWLEFDRGYDRGVDGLGWVAKGATKVLGADSPGVWLGVVVSAWVAVVGGFLWVRFPPGEVLELLGAGLADHRWDNLRAWVAALIALGALGAVVLRTWPAQLVALSVSGFMTTVYFVLYRAPDLALTQILVDTVSLVLIVTLLARFPKSAQAGEEVGRRWSGRRWMALGVAAGFGVMMTAMGVLVTARPHSSPVGGWYLEKTVPLAEGANAVNTLLVDFRGFDTLGEVTVLVVAMLGCMGLLFRRRRTQAERRAGAMGPAGLGIELEAPAGEAKAPGAGEGRT